MNNQQLEHRIVHQQSLVIRMLQGAALALLLLLLFFAFIAYFSDGGLGVGKWIFIPLTIVTFGGACGGVGFYLMDYLRYQGAWQKVATNILFVILYFPGLYFCLIFSLSLTGHWN